MNILSELTISPMQLSDLEEIKDKLEKNFNNFWNFEIFKSELVNTNSSYLIARYHSEIVGYAGIKKVLEIADIMNIVTRIDFRNVGIASCLLQHLILLAQNVNCTTLTLEVNENNLPAIHLYQKFEFKQVGLRKKYYQGIDNAILMTREI